MPRVVRIPLAVPFQMLAAFKVLEMKFFVIVDGAVVVHDPCAGCQEFEDAVFINSDPAFCFMRGVIGNFFIYIKPEACPFCHDHYDSVIPVQHPSGDQKLFEVIAELHEAVCSMIERTISLSTLVI